jgi:hypothetical protein
MHLRELVDLAALVSTHGPRLISQPTPFSPDGIQQYWVASRCRLDRWGRGLKYALSEIDLPADRRDPSRTNSIRPLIEEVLISEMLTRVWSAAVSAHDRRHGVDTSEPITRTIMNSHLEARHRALKLLIRLPEVESEDSIALQRTRRLAERWTDLLLGRMLPVEEIGKFAIDQRRAHEYARDIAHERQSPEGDTAWMLRLTSLRAAFGTGLSAVSPNADLNGRVATGVLACLPADVQDSTGLFRSLWLERLDHTANDAQGMLDQLMNDEGMAV